MFVKAIEVATAFTRPLLSIERFYGSSEVLRGASTLFFVNGDGWALTCKHVANLIVGGEQLGTRKRQFEQELAAMLGKKKEKQIRRELEQKYQVDHKKVFEIKSRFINCVEGPLQVTMHAHPKYDVALLHFEKFSKLSCSSFPVFAKEGSDLKQGKFLCRLGFPFPEFTNYRYDAATDAINWTTTGKDVTPIFPIEGMLTRHLSDDQGRIMGFELSTPGLRGQSGCPVFDVEGRVWGMQSATNHLDLDFDVDQEVIRGGVKRKVKDSAFLHVGHCVHVDVLKEFLTSKGVSFKDG